MEVVLCVEFDGVFVHNAYVCTDGKKQVSRIKHGLRGHASDYVPSYSSTAFHEASTCSAGHLSSGNRGFEEMMVDLLQAVRKRANKAAKTPITTLKLFHSSHPNPEQDKKFISAALNAGFTSVQICSLATAIPALASTSFPTVLLVHLRGTATELSLVTFSDATPTILFTATAPLGISQFADAAVQLYRRGAEERGYSKEYFEKMFMNHFYPPQLQDTTSEVAGQARHDHNMVIMSVLQNSFFHIADELNHRLLYDINWWKRDYPDLKVLVVPEQLRTLLTMASGNGTLASRYEIWNPSRVTYIAELCKTSLVPCSDFRVSDSKSMEILYEVYHPVCNTPEDEDTNIPSVTVSTWVSTLMTADDLIKPQLSLLGVCRNIFPSQDAHESFGIRFAANKLGQVVNCRLVRPNCIVTETLPYTSFGIKIFDVYKLECDVPIQQQFCLSFPAESDVKTLTPNGWDNSYHSYVAKDDNGFHVSRVQDDESVMVRQWEGQFPSWYQWTSAGCLACQKGSHLLIYDIENGSEPVTFPLGNEVSNMRWKSLYEVEVQGSRLWILLAKRTKKLLQLDSYGYPRSTGCVRILTKCNAETPITINAAANASVLACTSLGKIQHLSLALAMQQQGAGDPYCLRRVDLAPEGSDGQREPSYAKAKESVLWNTSFKLGEHDEPVAVHESATYGLLFVVTSHNIVFAFLTSSGQMLFRYVGTLNFIKESIIIDDGQDEDLVLSTHNNQVFSIKFDAKAVCTKALQMGEIGFSLDLMTRFKMRRTQEMFLDTLPQMLPCDDWKYVADAMMCIDDVNHVELIRSFVKQFPDILNAKAILTIMWNQYSLSDLEGILEVFVGRNYTAGVEAFLAMICRTESVVVQSCKRLLQSCVQAANEFGPTAALLELIELICLKNPTFLPLNIMDILRRNYFLLTKENTSIADLCSRFVSALAAKNDDAFLIQLLETMGYHGIVALMNCRAKDKLLAEALRRLTAVMPAEQRRIAQAVFERARFAELMDWVQMYPACLNGELGTKIAIAMLNSETHGSLFERFTTICGCNIFLAKVIEGAALSTVMTSALWSAVARLCLTWGIMENAVAILGKYPLASEKFGSHLLRELRDIKSDADIPWLKLVEYYDAVPGSDLQEEAMALLKQKAPDAVAYVYSKRGSYDEFRGIFSETRPRSQPEAGRCVICLDAKADCVYLPCGHVASCGKCAERTSACPVCRQECTAKQKVYLP